LGSPAVPLVKVIRHGSSSASSAACAGLGVEEPLVGDGQHDRVRAGGLELGQVALVGDDDLRPGDLQAQAQVLRAQLLGGREHHRAEAEARHHRQHPLGPVADQRHDDVAPLDPPRGQRAGQPSGLVGHLSEGPFAPLAAPGELDQGERCGVGGVDDRVREVHATFAPGTAAQDTGLESGHGRDPELGQDR
jgi:hypothetical protein